MMNKERVFTEEDAMKKLYIAVALVAGLLVTFAPLTTADAADKIRLRVGSSGYKVVKLQIALDTNKRRDYFHYKGYTGYFGSITKEGLNKWKARNGYKANGRITVGGAAWRKLMNQSRPVIDSRCKTGKRVACVDLTTNVLRFMRFGEVKKVIPIRDGKPGYETRQGVYRIYGKERDAFSNLYYVPMPYSLKFSGGQFIHYSAEFDRVGYTMAGSHGCVNIGDKDVAAWLYSKMRVGDKVVTYRS